MTEQEQVAQAALALVHPTTSPAQRSEASVFLEQWTTTSPQAWITYGHWLQSFTSSNEHAATRLLCLTMLLAKIRREVPYGTTLESTSPVFVVKKELWLQLHKTQHNNDATMRPMCSCLAAMAVRCGTTQELLATTTLPRLALVLLSSIPGEMEACTNFTDAAQVTKELRGPHLAFVLTMIQHALLVNNTDDTQTTAAALEALCKWTETCHVSLTELNSKRQEHEKSILQVLVDLLSFHNHYNESVVTSACRTLTEATEVLADSFTTSRNDIIAEMLKALVTRGFLVAPMSYATTSSGHHWKDPTTCVHAMATMVSTLVVQDGDFICSQAAPTQLLDLLFALQSYPQTSVTLVILDCWLAVQDLSTSERHDDWKQSLLVRVVQTLIPRVAYPSMDFTSWEDEVEAEESEFVEMRMLVKDIHISCYYLLRCKLLELVVPCCVSGNNNNNHHHDWTTRESALTCLNGISPDVCQRTKSTLAPTKADRERTIQLLLQLVHYLLDRTNQQRHHHPQLLCTMLQFFGSYASVWSRFGTPDLLFQMLDFVRAVMGHPAVVGSAATATRSILVSCHEKLLQHDNKRVQETLLQLMEALLSVPNLEPTHACYANMAEGITRFILKVKNDPLLGRLVSPLMQRAQEALTTLTSGSGPHVVNVAGQELVKNLFILEHIVKFCEVPNHAAHPLTELVPVLLPFLKSVSDAAMAMEGGDVLVGVVLDLHVQLLQRNLIRSHFGDVVTMVVHIFEQSKHGNALKYVSIALESLSPLQDRETIESFSKLLGHVTSIICTHFHSNGATLEDGPELIGAFAEMCDHFVLFCPSALIGSHDFSTIVALAAEGLKTTLSRPILIFLSHLFGWRDLRLPQDAAAALETGSAGIDNQYATHGETITQVCVAGLAGGSQSLFPALSECLLVILLYVPAEPHAQKWLYDTIVNSNTTNLTPEACESFIKMLSGLLHDGKQSKQKAKLLLQSFTKILKGELQIDAVLTSSLLDQ